MVASVVLHTPLLIAAVETLLRVDDPGVIELARVHDVELVRETAPQTQPDETPPPEEPIEGESAGSEADLSGSRSTRASEAQRSLPRPAAAQAARVLGFDEIGDDAVDFTMVQGAADAYVGGVTSSEGTSERPVYDQRAFGAGVKPSAPKPKRRVAKRRAPLVDRSVPARPLAKSWDCGFPKAADAAQIHRAVVRLVVTVAADGTPVGASVLSDPGHGFGERARRCAMSRRFGPARDQTGRPITATTAPITVRFVR